MSDDEECSTPGCTLYAGHMDTCNPPKREIYSRRGVTYPGQTEREIVVTSYDLTDEEHQALFDRVADAAHALSQQVTCATSLAPVNPVDGKFYPNKVGHGWAGRD